MIVESSRKWQKDAISEWTAVGKETICHESEKANGSQSTWATQAVVRTSESEKHEESIH